MLDCYDTNRHNEGNNSSAQKKKKKMTLVHLKQAEPYRSATWAQGRRPSIRQPDLFYQLSEMIYRQAVLK